MSAKFEHGGLHILGKSVTGRETSEAEIREFMQLGVDKNGKPISIEMLENFNDHSKKEFPDLAQELNDSEATLSIGPVEPWPNRVIRGATSIKFTIINPAAHMRLKEVLHSYKGVQYFVLQNNLNNVPDTVKLIKGDHSGSETMIRGESEDETLERGLIQELDLHPGEYEIIGKILHLQGIGGLPNFHESNTYEYIFSREWIKAEFTVHTTKFGTSAPMVRDDHGKTTLRIWEPCVPFDTNMTIAQLRELGHEI